MGKRGSAGHLCYSVTFSHKANVYCQHNLFCSCNQSLKLGPQQRGSAEIGRDRHVGICRYMSVQCRYMSVSRRYKSVSCRYVSVYVGIMSVCVGICRYHVGICRKMSVPRTGGGLILCGEGYNESIEKSGI